MTFASASHLPIARATSNAIIIATAPRVRRILFLSFSLSLSLSFARIFDTFWSTVKLIPTSIRECFPSIFSPFSPERKQSKKQSKKMSKNFGTRRRHKKRAKTPPHFWSCHTTGKSATGRDGQKASDEGVEQRSSIIARAREREESKPRAE